MKKAPIDRRQFNLRVYMDGALLSEDPQYELARILRKAANEVGTGSISQPNILDQNGNTVGWYEIQEEG
ncbi:MAG: hypothetical protein EOM59_16265 [Clostridia bacterium]|nr:hypothetical protein [Clostridia bacterium]